MTLAAMETQVCPSLWFCFIVLCFAFVLLCIKATDQIYIMFLLINIIRIKPTDMYDSFTYVS